MKLNPDCIRTILIWLEENQGIDARTGRPREIISTELPKYITEFSNEDVLYSVRQMILDGFLQARPMDVAGADLYLVEDIMPKGHDFLGNIRSEDNWKRTKSIAGKVGAITLDVLSTIAAKVVAEVIAKNMGELRS